MYGAIVFHNLTTGVLVDYNYADENDNYDHGWGRCARVLRLILDTMRYHQLVAVLQTTYSLLLTTYYVLLTIYYLLRAYYLPLTVSASLAIWRLRPARDNRSYRPQLAGRMQNRNSYWISNTMEAGVYSARCVVRKIAYRISISYK